MNNDQYVEMMREIQVLTAKLKHTEAVAEQACDCLELEGASVMADIMRRKLRQYRSTEEKTDE